MALSDEGAGISFLLKAKCAVNMNHAGGQVGNPGALRRHLLFRSWPATRLIAQPYRAGTAGGEKVDCDGQYDAIIPLSACLPLLSDIEAGARLSGGRGPETGPFRRPSTKKTRCCHAGLRILLLRRVFRGKIWH